jgi:hypothetical protein
MGMVPVAPSSKRLLLPGARVLSGFRVKPALVGFSSREITYIPTLT